MEKSIKKNTEKDKEHLNKDVVSNELLKKRTNQPDKAKENLDIPGARNARPITNDRHQDDEIKQDKGAKK